MATSTSLLAVVFWWVDLGWLHGAHQATLSLPLPSRINALIINICPSPLPILLPPSFYCSAWISLWSLWVRCPGCIPAPSFAHPQARGCRASPDAGRALLSRNQTTGVLSAPTREMCFFVSVANVFTKPKPKQQQKTHTVLLGLRQVPARLSNREGTEIYFQVCLQRKR